VIRDTCADPDFTLTIKPSDVPRMLRSAISAFTRVFDALCLAAWRAADPGSIFF
jgi:hypothetical protein